MSPPTPAASVVIPAYNYAHYLPDAIRSVLGQTCADLELIVVDDGSTDSTPEVVAQFTDPRVRYIRQENAGLPAARNTGIKAARAPLVGFLDADDLWKPERLASAIAAFAELPAEFAIVACYPGMIDAGGTPLPEKFPRGGSREVTAADIIIKTRFAPSSVVAKREAFDEAGLFDTSLTSSEDREMWIRIGGRRRIFLQGEALIQLRQHPGSMRRNADRMASNMGRVIRRAFARGAVPRRRIFFWLRVFSFHLYQVARMHLDERRLGRAAWELLLSLASWPCFGSPELLDAPAFFRVRCARRLVKALLTPSA